MTHPFLQNLQYLTAKGQSSVPLPRGTTGGVQTDLVTPCRKKRGEAERARLKWHDL